MANMPVYTIPVYTDQKDCCIKKSYMGFVKKEKMN